MKRYRFTILALATAVLVLSACGEGDVAQKAAVDVKAATASTPAPAAVPAKAPAAATQVAEGENEPPPLTVPRGYRYEPQGRRDPFVNPAPTKPGGGATAEVQPTVRPDGLPGVLVSEVKVSGIVYSSEPAMKKVMLAAGRKTYFAAQGDSLFDGVIKEIRPNEVVFTMVSAATKQPVNKETIVPTGGSSATLAGEKK